MVGILGGAFLGAYAFDQLVEERGGWEAGLLVCAFISVLALFSWIISGPIPETQVTGNKPFRLSLMVSHFSDLFYLLKHKELRYAALGDAWFWAVGGFFYLVLVKLSGGRFRKSWNGYTLRILVSFAWSGYDAWKFILCLSQPWKN